MNMKKLRFLSILILVPLVLFAQYERPGSAGGQFLSIGVDPRAAGMGGAFISVTDGAEATYYNPAAIVNVGHNALSFTHTSWFAGINHDFAAFVTNRDKIGSFGLIFTGLVTDEMEVRTPLQPDGTGETFYAGNYRFGLVYARYMTNHVSFGGSVNYVYSSLYKDFSASAVFVDISVLYQTQFRDFRFGMKIENFGSELKFINESYPLPTNFQFGLSINAVQSESNKLLVSFAAQKPNVGKPIGSVGAEWNYKNLIYLRAGYKLNNEVQKYALGFGLGWTFKQKRIIFNYSYSDFSLLGTVNRFGLNLGF